MKRRYYLAILGIGAFIGIGNAEISVTVPDNCDATSMIYYYAPIKQFASAKTRAERGIEVDSVNFISHKAAIEIPTTSDSYLYALNVEGHEISLYVVPGENITVDISNCRPFNYTMHGSALVDGMNELNALEAPIIEKVMLLNSAGNDSEESMDELSKLYAEVQKEYIKNHSGGAAVPVALMNLEGEDYIHTYDSLRSTMQNSILLPLAEKQYETEKKNLEMAKKQEAMQSGQVEAPNFTLKDLDGNDVSLTDYIGKWVILDFWGSWCPWCIKGFPELKEAYEEYKGQLEIIGVDCKESEADWKAGVAKYQLQWVNVYNPDGSSLLTEYGVQGFPTKAIITPEGKIANITVGHDPQFFNILKELMSK